jgi:hypothetical protein
MSQVVGQAFQPDARVRWACVPDAEVDQAFQPDATDHALSRTEDSISLD